MVFKISDNSSSCERTLLQPGFSREAETGTSEGSDILGTEEELRDSAGESHGRTDLPADGPSHRDTESGKIFQNGEKYQNRRQPNGKSSWYPAGQKPGSEAFRAVKTAK